VPIRDTGDHKYAFVRAAEEWIEVVDALRPIAEASTDSAFLSMVRELSRNAEDARRAVKFLKSDENKEAIRQFYEEWKRKYLALLRAKERLNEFPEL